MDNIEIVDETTSSAFFDEAISHIQDIILSEQFENMQDNFFEANWKRFDFAEENKLEYMDIFLKYQELFEECIHDQLLKRMPHFDMKRFALDLEKYTKANDPLYMDEIHELLQSFNDFAKFKEVMLDYRRKKEGHMAHMDDNILITKPCL